VESLIEKILGPKVGTARVIPLFAKIVMLFIFFILMSNFSSNYINLLLNRGELIKLESTILIKELKDMYGFLNNQHEIFTFKQDQNTVIESTEQKALKDFKRKKSLFLGIAPDGNVFFSASPTVKFEGLSEDVLAQLNNNRSNKVMEGSLNFELSGMNYFSVYKFHQQWGVYIIRAEEINEFYADSKKIFYRVSGIIVLLTLICAILGSMLLKRLLKFVHIITESLMKMQENQTLDLINLKNAPNDDVTYLGVSFNALAGTINNLMSIFTKFVARDVASRAYKEKQVRLEGSKKRLTILFTDIRSFTYMTETLGTDIIKLLNVHYEQAIACIHDRDGIIGSIIGDALLAVYGTAESEGNSSLQAIQSSYLLQEVASQLRQRMRERCEYLLKYKGGMSSDDEKVYKAVLLEIGVGIDAGEVFYGNIGSTSRMTNTVIGDTVNASSRLEGLTRIYNVPIICSESVRDEVESLTNEYHFQELDQVMVKGKTEGKKVFWPIKREVIDDDLSHALEQQDKGLKLYMEGDWRGAETYFRASSLPVSELFVNRISGRECPDDWNGIWTMKTK